MNAVVKKWVFALIPGNCFLKSDGNWYVLSDRLSYGCWSNSSYCSSNSKQMTHQIDPEKFIQELNKIKMTPEEKKIAAAEELGGILGKLIGSVVASAIIAGIIYAILALMIGLSVTYLQVFGVILLLDFIKAFIKK